MREKNEILRNLFFLFWTILICGSLNAQTDRIIRIRMLDSKTGQPITTSEFMVWFDHELGPGVRWVKQDREGVGDLTLSAASSAKVMLVDSGASVSSWIENCDSVRHFGRHHDNWYSVSDILVSGVVAPNYCSGRRAVAKPGEFVFYVRPATFWEKLWINP